MSATDNKKGPMEAAQQAASAVNTAMSASNASAQGLAEVKEAAEKAVAMVTAALDTFAQAAAVGATTTEEAEASALGAIEACDTAVEAAQNLGSPDPINHTTQAQYEAQTALAHISAAKEATHTLQGMIETIKSELTEPLISAASAVEDNAVGPMQTGAGALDNAKSHLEAIT
jgi:hypothetical protein